MKRLTKMLMRLHYTTNFTISSNVKSFSKHCRPILSARHSKARPATWILDHSYLNQ